jgi:hypothetical protein
MRGGEYDANGKKGMASTSTGSIGSEPNNGRSRIQTD